MPILCRPLVLLLMLAAAVAPVGAQPYLSAGLETGYVEGPYVSGPGFAAAPALGLRWGRLVAAARPVEYGYHVDALRICEEVPPGPDTPCWRETRTMLASALGAAYALPVRGRLALTAGAGVRFRWYDSHVRRPDPEGRSSDLRWEAPHLALGAQYDVSDRWSVSIRTETQVYRGTVLFLDEDGGVDSSAPGFHPAFSRVTVGVAVPLGRARR